MRGLFERYFSDVARNFEGVEAVGESDVRTRRVKQEDGVEYFEMSTWDRETRTEEHYVFERGEALEQPRCLGANLDTSLFGIVFSVSRGKVSILVRIDVTRAEGYSPLVADHFRTAEDLIHFVKNTVLPVHETSSKTIDNTGTGLQARDIEQGCDGIEKMYAFGRMSNSIKHNTLCNFLDSYVVTPNKSDAQFREKLVNFQHSAFERTTTFPKVLCLSKDGYSGLYMNEEKICLKDCHNLVFGSIGFDLSRFILDGEYTRHFFIEIVTELGKYYLEGFNLTMEDFLNEVRLGCLLYLILSASKINDKDRRTMLSELELFCCANKLFAF